MLSSIIHINRNWPRHLFRPAFLACILLLCTTCQKMDYDEIITTPGTQRILIAYLAGDNNLSTEIEQKITALATGFFNTGTGDLNNRLFIYSDTRSAQPQLVEITNTHNGPRRVLKTYPAQNSANASVMAQVLYDVLYNYTAESYGLIVFSHGTAWLPAGGLENPYSTTEDTEGTEEEKAPEADTRTVAIDGNNELELTDFAASLPLPGGKKWDFILFENCFMASVEVAYELRNKTEAIIASATEIVSPGMTEVYPSALPYLYKGTPALESFAEAYFNHWNAKSGNYRSATVSVVRTARLEELASLARAAFVRWQPDEETIAALQCFNRNKWHLFFDLEEAMLTANPSLEEYIDGLLPHIVTYAAATPSFIEGESYGFKIDRHCGLSCYLLQEGFPFLNLRYRQLSWSTVVYP